VIVICGAVEIAAAIIAHDCLRAVRLQRFRLSINQTAAVALEHRRPRQRVRLQHLTLMVPLVCIEFVEASELFAAGTIPLGLMIVFFQERDERRAAVQAFNHQVARDSSPPEVLLPKKWSRLSIGLCSWRCGRADEPVHGGHVAPQQTQAFERNFTQFAFRIQVVLGSVRHYFVAESAYE
jgi:hypothetical protein